MLDDDLEINICSQDHCTADHRLITTERISKRLPACSCLARFKTSLCKVVHDFAGEEVQVFSRDGVGEYQEEIVDPIVYIS